MDSRSERIIARYEDHAAAWDRQRGRDLHEKPWLDRFAAALPPGATILDLGCGMGEPVASYLIESGFAVTGLDSSASLIALCRQRFPEREWIVEHMRKLALGRRFDGIIAWHSLIHLTPEDQRTAFPRFAAHLNPGGALMVTTGPERGESIGEWQGEPLYHGSLAAREYEGLFADSGYTLLDRVLRDPECGAATVWLARLSPEKACA